uniref:Uncharacterized protein n=1 Tax=Solanum lycopersicum TaxID=4081 RepID=A0A3Q7GAE6_SOLLC
MGVGIGVDRYVSALLWSTELMMSARLSGTLSFQEEAVTYLII